MEIHERPCDVEGVRLLDIDGGLDHTNTEAFARKMHDLLQEGSPRVVLDLEHLTYASSLGLAALRQIHHHGVARGGRVAFANLHSAVATLLRLSHLDRQFDLYPTVGDAIRHVAPAQPDAAE
ncbi:MAG TPA: STAS domain-containing protein [Phycisphaerae bacterium]|nr:STAS domain-containing protein [Phycisphaerae bacterium]